MSGHWVQGEEERWEGANKDSLAAPILPQVGATCRQKDIYYSKRSQICKNVVSSMWLKDTLCAYLEQK